MNPIEYIDLHKNAILETYHDLHSLAEPSWEEEKTSKYIRNRLVEAGFHVKTFQAHYGLIAELKGELESVVAIRADMDALVQEVEGVVRANHSCGHDAHSTMVLYTALALASSGIKPKHTIRFIFQPAEEKGEGALQMMDDGALEHVISLFGIHVRPKSEVPFLHASPVIIHGSAETIRGTFKGRQAHASRPQDGINAIEMATLLVMKLKTIKIDTDTPFSIKITQLKTENEASNVIPETATFTLDVRAQTNEVMELLNETVTYIFCEIMDETKGTMTWSMEEFVPAAVLHKGATEIVSRAIADILGAKNVVHKCISNGGEDFHFYTNRYPNIAATMIGLGCDLNYGLHHPQMNFNLDALHYGTKILVQSVLLALEESTISI